jgi:hypothetical protein
MRETQSESSSRHFSLREQPWWTEADAAELRYLTEVCVGALLDWRSQRILKSKAEWLRTREKERHDRTA